MYGMTWPPKEPTTPYGTQARPNNHGGGCFTPIDCDLETGASLRDIDVADP
jgi:hypothetical protein